MVFARIRDRVKSRASVSLRSGTDIGLKSTFRSATGYVVVSDRVMVRFRLRARVSYMVRVWYRQSSGLGL